MLLLSAHCVVVPLGRPLGSVLSPSHNVCIDCFAGTARCIEHLSSIGDRVMRHVAMRHVAMNHTLLLLLHNVYVCAGEVVAAETQESAASLSVQTSSATNLTIPTCYVVTLLCCLCRRGGGGQDAGGRCQGG